MAMWINTIIPFNISALNFFDSVIQSGCLDYLSIVWQQNRKQLWKEPYYGSTFIILHQHFVSFFAELQILPFSLSLFLILKQSFSSLNFILLERARQTKKSGKKLFCYLCMCAPVCIILPISIMHIKDVYITSNYLNVLCLKGWFLCFDAVK